MMDLAQFVLVVVPIWITLFLCVLFLLAALWPQKDNRRVHVLWWDCGTRELLGVYQSRTEAEMAMGRYEELKLYRYAPGDFSIDEVSLNADLVEDEDE